jgi:phosphopentomutase
MKDVLLVTRRLLEEVKEYSVTSRVEYIRERAEDVEKNQIEVGKMAKLVETTDLHAMNRSKDVTDKLSRLVDTNKADAQRQINELQGDMARAENKLDNVQTYEESKKYVDDNVAELKAMIETKN